MPRALASLYRAVPPDVPAIDDETVIINEISGYTPVTR